MKHLRRDTNNEMIAGVCAGVANYFGLDPFFLRIIFVIACIAGVGSPFLIYLACWILIPGDD